MTTYPLEYYLSTVGTPHIKIVDWNAWYLSKPGFGGCKDQITLTKEVHKVYGVVHRAVPRMDPRNFHLDTFSINYDGNESLLIVPKPEHRIAEAGSDDHMMLILKYGEVDWFEISEEEAVALMQASGDGQ
jgi:hypothetical protein